MCISLYTTLKRKFTPLFTKERSVGRTRILSLSLTFADSCVTAAHHLCHMYRPALSSPFNAVVADPPIPICVDVGDCFHPSLNLFFKLASSCFWTDLVVSLAVVIVLEEEVLVGAVRGESDGRDSQTRERAVEAAPPAELALVAPGLTVLNCQLCWNSCACVVQV